MMRAAPLTLPDTGRAQLYRWVRSTTTKAGLVLRAKIVLAAADGVPHAEIAGKVTDIVGLYMNPPESAIVLCLDEKSQIQALDRTAPTLPLRIGMPEKQTHDYIRHGTTTLFAALEIATGKIAGTCKPKHHQQEFLSFLEQIAKAYPDRDLHLVMDNYATHKTPSVKELQTRRTSISRTFLSKVCLRGHVSAMAYSPMRCATSCGVSICGECPAWSMTSIRVPGTSR